MSQIAPNILIIDDAAYFRLLVRHMLQSALPDATLTEYDPVSNGRPDEDFDWGQFDVLLLDYKLGDEDGIAWFKAYKHMPGFPATIIFTGEGNESIAVLAMKSGVDDYLTKVDLTVDKLKVAIVEAYEAIEERREQAAESVGAPGDSDHTILGNPEQLMAKVTGRDLLLNPEVIPGYRVLDKLGSGATATAYLAERDEDGRRLVLKVLNAELMDNRTLFQRFLAEYRLIREIKSRYLVCISEQGFTEDHCFIVMEYFSGGDLRRRIDQGLEPSKALYFLAQLAVGLHALHGKGIVHRDIKPENIMFREDGSLALVDFGIARQMEHDAGLTRHGELFGTPHYISPEQLAGDVADFRSDLFSLGVILYEMLTGTRPFQADSLYNLFYKQMNEDVPALPGDLQPYNALVQRLLAKAPDDRFQSAAELFRHLQNEWGIGRRKENVGG